MRPSRLCLIPLLLLAACDNPKSPAPPTPAPAAPSAAPPPPPTAVAPATGALAATIAPEAPPPTTVKVLNFTFPIPHGWKSVPPSNSMRLAELRVPDPAGDPAKDCLVVFSTAGGTVLANMERWAGQFRDASGQIPQPRIRTRMGGGPTVHLAEFTGTYTPGMSDPKTYTDWMLRGAILDTPQGMIFIKMTGPAAAMASLGIPFEEMVEAGK